MFENEKFRAKFGVKVEVTLIDGRKMCGDLFLNQDQRVLDLFNDDRPFVPFEDTGGSVRVLRKTAIMEIRPIQPKPSVAEPIPLSVAMEQRRRLTLVDDA